MTRLRSLIKEALSTPPKKKDCGCGCNTCDSKKSPIITEGKIKNAISEGLKYHVDKNIPLHESVYRIGSEKHFELINEARKLWVRGLIDVSEDDQAILETNLGNFGMYEGEKVPLDMPMVSEIVLLKDRPFDYQKDYIAQNKFGYDFNELEPEDQDIVLSMIDDLEDEIGESLNEDEAAFEYNKARAGRIMKDLFGSDFEFDYTYKLEGDRIIIHPEGYNPDGTLFDMKDVHKEKIIRTFRDKMPKAQATPNMGGGITVNLNRSSLNEEKYLENDNYEVDGTSVGDGKYEDEESEKQKESLEKDYIEHLQNIRNDFYNKGDKEKAAEVQADIDKLLDKSLEERIRSILESQKLPNGDIYLGQDDKGNHKIKSKDKITLYNNEDMVLIYGKGWGHNLNEAKKKKKKKKKDPPIGKPKRGGSKAYYVYVRDPKTKKIKKVSFGSGGLRAKIKNAEARKRFAARHNCKNKKDRTTAGYWSCNLPRYAEQLGLGSKMNTFW